MHLLLKSCIATTLYHWLQCAVRTACTACMLLHAQCAACTTYAQKKGSTTPMCTRCMPSRPKPTSILMLFAMRSPKPWPLRTAKLSYRRLLLLLLLLPFVFLPFGDAPKPPRRFSGGVSAGIKGGFSPCSSSLLLQPLLLVLLVLVLL
jgi:hypothetical protein